MNKTAVEWLIDWMDKNDYFIGNCLLQAVEEAKQMEKDQLGALYLTLLLNTPDIAQFDFEEWYKQNTSHE